MKIVTVAKKQAPAKYVPAAAVIRMEQALSGIIGRKGYVGCYVGLYLKAMAQPMYGMETA